MLNGPEYKKIIDNLVSGPENLLKYYSDIPFETDYNDRIPSTKNTVHVGQLKLLLSEIEFLTELEPEIRDSILFVYAGSAPSNHISIVHDLFPEITFLLVDPNEHDIWYNDVQKRHSHYDEGYRDSVLYFHTGPRRFGNKHRLQDYINYYEFESGKISLINRNSENLNNRIGNPELKKILEVIRNRKYTYYILEDLFTEELAETLREVPEFKYRYFISDIRTTTGLAEFGSDESMPGDADTLWNSAQQLIWLHKMQPDACMLKFRTPFFGAFKKQLETLKDYQIRDFESAKNLEPGIDFLNDYRSETFRYIKPYRIFIQAFPGSNSSESRFMAKKYSEYEIMDWRTYENRFAYYNRFVRGQSFYSNEFYFNKKFGIDGCADCALMIRIFQEYYEKYIEPQNNPPEKKKWIRDIITKSLISMNRTLYHRDNFHGNMYKKEFRTPEEFINRLSGNIDSKSFP